MLVINKDNVLDILQATVDKYATDGDPSNTYRDCQYVNLDDDPESNELYGAPICVVGCALIDAGVPVAKFEGMVPNDFTRINYEKIGTITDKGLFDEYVIIEDEVAKSVVATAQSTQDDGQDWDTMMRNARRRYAILTGTDY
jgi:hypothetical protein